LGLTESADCPGCGTLINPGNPNNDIKTQCFTISTAPSAAFYTANCDSAFGTFPPCFNLRGNAGRNILVGPGTSSLDFSVFKNNYIKRLSNWSCGFNCFDHPTAREIQFVLKLTW
jgi:hypothetical protein